ncbi:MAG: SRPBCC domain-containing protein [Burkholderiales bacterium]|nr:SRPBCC domain-containing protein [Bacteroidia bacterium]
METNNSRELKITRILNATPELVFKTFTEVEHLAHWWGPAGMKLEVITLDVRNGGKFH